VKRRPTASVGTPSAFAILVLAAALAVPVKGAASVTFVGFALTQTGAQLNRLSFAVKVKKGKVMGGKFQVRTSVGAAVFVRREERRHPFVQALPGAPVVRAGGQGEARRGARGRRRRMLLYR
jgi:hypothetical protein